MLVRLGKWGWAILTCALALAAKPSEALSPNACIPLFDPDYDRASLAYANVEISGERSACFLLPRNVIHKELREFNSQGSVMLDPADLLSYLSGKASIRVGTEDRTIDQALIDCLSASLPDVIMITDGPPFSSHSLASLTSEHLKWNLAPPELAISDLAGYRRYTSVGPKYREGFYFADSGPDGRLSFWCGNHTEPEMCMIQGEYDGMKARVGYHKGKMEQVRPKEALNCVRSIGDLFRIDNDKS
jgi:hypothetical protein